MNSIAGVTLNVYKQDRLLAVEEDGYVGQLCSGYAVLEAVIDPGLPMIGMICHGRDTYIRQKNWLTLPDFTTKRWQIELKERMKQRTFAPGTKVYGIKMGLEAADGTNAPFVSYPNNMLCLAELVRQGGKLTGQVVVWRLAIVTQDDDFFLTCEKANQRSDEYQCTRDDDGTLRFPRLEYHESLNDLLVSFLPQDIVVPSSADYVCEDEVQRGGLGKNEGIVTSFYQARGVGTLATREGTVRVGWRDAPQRPRRRFLVQGERVRFGSLDTPVTSIRETSFEKQAFDISLV